MAESVLTGLVIAHTHWDRAWYLPFASYRTHLIMMIDRILDLLQQDPDYRCFTLDGQTVVLEDYREIRPHRWPEVARHVQSGRLHVGPFFVLPDEFLVSGEALIRNLQRGIRLVESLGGSCQDGYMPDSFGHLAQMPQVLQGFGLRSFLFMRGMSTADFERLGTEFWWQAPDGSRVLALYLRGGYDNLSALGHPHRFGDFKGHPPDPEQACQLVQAAVELLAPHTPSGILILCNGGDHMPPQPELPYLLKSMQPLLPQMDLRQSSFSEAVSAVLAQGLTHPTYAGDFLGNGHHPVLSNVWSSRIDLKIWNQRLQSLLETVAEPLAAALGPAGIPWVALLEEAWRHLLLCHPHDDICGCGRDDIHQDNAFHFRQAELTAHSVVDECLRQLALKGGLIHQAGQELIALFNPHPWAARDWVEVEVFWGQETLDPTQWELLDPQGQSIPFHLVQPFTSKPQPPDFQARYLTYSWGHRLSIRLQVNLAALSFTVYRLRIRDHPLPALPPLTQDSPAEIENDLYRIRWEPEGTLTLIHLPTGRHFPNALQFEDQPDEGDLYSCSLVDPSTVSPEWGFRLREHQPGYSRLHLVQRWESDATPIEITTVITLVDGSSWVDFHTTITNHRPNHRLRVWLPLPGSQPDQRVIANSSFLWQWQTPPHPIEPEADLERYNRYPGEMVYPTQFSQGWIYAPHPQVPVLIAHRGLHEYEVLGAGNTCALTVLRAVGTVSRSQGRIRRVQAGPSIPTPEAQCLGTYEVHYGWQCLDPKIALEAVASRALPWIHPTLAKQVNLGQYEPTDPQPIPFPVGLMEWDNPLLCLSALKLDPQGRLIVRLFNPSPDPQLTTLTFTNPLWSDPLRVWTADLNEHPQDPLEVTKRQVFLKFKGFQIVSVVATFG